MIDEPLWVQTDAVQELLVRLVDGLDKADKAGSVSARAVALSERTWPALYRAPFESRKEELWEHIGEMCRWGWLVVTPESASNKTSGYDDAPKVRVRDQTQVRAAIKRLTRVKSSAERWKEAVARRLDASETAQAVVSGYCIDIPERSMEDVVERLNQLQALAGKPLLLREVSAKLFWGMSKLLDKRQNLVAAILGMDECPFPESPIQLQVYLPRDYGAVLLIENQVSFERALRSDAPVFADLALVYASGFKGSAQRLRKPETCSLFYSQRGERSEQAANRFESWLFADRPADPMPVWFWDDLDYAGMRILAALRRSFSDIKAWETGYAPMLKELEAGLGHLPEAADKAGQKPIAQTGCRYADQVLLPAINRDGKFVDQEIFDWSR